MTARVHANRFCVLRVASSFLFNKISIKNLAFPFPLPMCSLSTTTTTTSTPTTTTIDKVTTEPFGLTMKKAEVGAVPSLVMVGVACLAN
jgi:hypothetical protein